MNSTGSPFLFSRDEAALRMWIGTSVSFNPTIFVIFYFNRAVGAIISYLLKAYVWHKHRASISLTSFQISILGGRLFFKGFRYHGSDATVLIHSGVVTWHYWRWRVLKTEIYTDGQAVAPGQTRLGERDQTIAGEIPVGGASTSGADHAGAASEKQGAGHARDPTATEFTLQPQKGSTSHGAADALETGGVPQTTKNAHARISVKFDGVEMYVYNWSPSIDALAVHLGYAHPDNPHESDDDSSEEETDNDDERERTSPRHDESNSGASAGGVSEGRSSGIDRFGESVGSGLRNNETVQRIRKMFKSIDPIARVRNRNRMRDRDSDSDSDTEAHEDGATANTAAFSTPPIEKPALPSFLSLLPISLSIHRAAIGIGNENTTHIVVINFETATGLCDAGTSANPLDVYLQLFRADLEKTRVQMIENPDFKEGLLERGRRLVDDALREKEGPDAGVNLGGAGEERHRRRGRGRWEDGRMDHGTGRGEVVDSDHDVLDAGHGVGAKIGRTAAAVLSRIRSSQSQATLNRRSSTVHDLHQQHQHHQNRSFTIPDTRPNGPRWLGLPRYLTEVPMSEKEEWMNLDYAVVTNVLESNKVGVCFYWDVPGVVQPMGAGWARPETRPGSGVGGVGPTGGNEKRFDASTARSPPLSSSRSYPSRRQPSAALDSSPPTFGLDLSLYGGVLTYGPWADRTRAQLQSVFFPNNYKNTKPPPRASSSRASPKLGEPRVYDAFKVLVTVEREMIVRIPFREGSKDFKWKGQARRSGGGIGGGTNAVAGRTDAGLWGHRTRVGQGHTGAGRSGRKSSTRLWNRKKNQKGEVDTGRPYGWVDLKVWPGTSVTYKMGMVPVLIPTGADDGTCPDSPRSARSRLERYGFVNTVHVEISKSETSTSVNQDVLWNSGPLVIKAEMPNPCAWNTIRDWRFGVEFKSGVEVFLLREHVYLITDLLGDWSSSRSIPSMDDGTGAPPPPPVEDDYYTFVPIKYYIDFKLQDFSFLLNSNPSNVISSPSDMSENDFLILRGDSVAASVCIPVVAYNPRRNEMMFDVNFSRAYVDLGLPPKNTGSAFMKDKNVGKVEKLTMGGSYAYSTATGGAGVAGAGTTDQLVVDVEGDNMSLLVFGTVLKHVLRLKDNYIGDFIHFRTNDEFYQAVADERAAAAEEADRTKKPPLHAHEGRAGVGDNRRDSVLQDLVAEFDPAKLPAKASDLDVMASLVFRDVNVILPANVFDASRNVAGTIRRVGMDVRVTNYYMDLTMDLSPFGLGPGKFASLDSQGEHNPEGRETMVGGVGDSASGGIIGFSSQARPSAASARTDPSSRRNSENVSSPSFGFPNIVSPVELFIDGIRIRAHRLFGLPNTEPTYAGLWTVHTGAVTGELSVGMVSRLMAVAEAVSFGMDDWENGVDLVPAAVTNDVMFVQLVVGGVRVAIVAGGDDGAAEGTDGQTVETDWAHHPGENEQSARRKRQAILVRTGIAEIEYNDWSRGSVTERLSVSVPDISLAVLELDCDSDAGTDDESYPTTRRMRAATATLANVKTSVSCQMAVSPKWNAYWTRYRAQQAHLMVHDLRTGRIPYLFLDEREELGGSESEGRNQGNGQISDRTGLYPIVSYKIDPPLSQVPRFYLPPSVLMLEPREGDGVGFGYGGNRTSNSIRSASLRSVSSSLVSAASTSSSRTSSSRSSFLQHEYFRPFSLPGPPRPAVNKMQLGASRSGGASTGGVVLQSLQGWEEFLGPSSDRQTQREGGERNRGRNSHTHRRSQRKRDFDYGEPNFVVPPAFPIAHFKPSSACMPPLYHQRHHRKRQQVDGQVQVKCASSHFPRSSGHHANADTESSSWNVSLRSGLFGVVDVVRAVSVLVRIATSIDKDVSIEDVLDWLYINGVDWKGESRLPAYGGGVDNNPVSGLASPLPLAPPPWPSSPPPTAKKDTSKKGVGLKLDIPTLAFRLVFSLEEEGEKGVASGADSAFGLGIGFGGLNAESGRESAATNHASSTGRESARRAGNGGDNEGYDFIDLSLDHLRFSARMVEGGRNKERRNVNEKGKKADKKGKKGKGLRVETQPRPDGRRHPSGPAAPRQVLDDTPAGPYVDIRALLSALQIQLGTATGVEPQRGFMAAENELDGHQRRQVDVDEKIHLTADLTKLVLTGSQTENEREDGREENLSAKTKIKLLFDLLSVTTSLSQVPGLAAAMERLYPALFELMSVVDDLSGSPKARKNGISSVHGHGDDAEVDNSKLSLARALLLRLAPFSSVLIDPLFLSRPPYLTPGGRPGVRSDEGWKSVVRVRALFDSLSDNLKRHIADQVLQTGHRPETDGQADLGPGAQMEEDPGDGNDFVSAWAREGGKPEWFAKRHHLVRKLEGVKEKKALSEPAAGYGLQSPLGWIPDVEVVGERMVAMCDEGDNASIFQVCPVLVKIGVDSGISGSPSIQSPAVVSSSSPDAPFVAVQLKADDFVFGLHWNMLHAVKPVMNLVTRLSETDIGKTETETGVAPSLKSGSKGKDHGSGVPTGFSMPRIHLAMSVLRPRVFLNTFHVRLLWSLDQFGLSACTDGSLGDSGGRGREEEAENEGGDDDAQEAAAMVWRSALVHAASSTLTVWAKTPDRVVAEWVSVEPTVNVALRTSSGLGTEPNFESSPIPDSWSVTGTAKRQEVTVLDELLDLLDLADVLVREEVTYAVGLLGEVQAMVEASERRKRMKAESGTPHETASMMTSLPARLSTGPSRLSSKPRPKPSPVMSLAFMMDSCALTVPLVRSLRYSVTGSVARVSVTPKPSVNRAREVIRTSGGSGTLPRLHLDHHSGSDFQSGMYPQIDEFDSDPHPDVHFDLRFDVDALVHQVEALDEDTDGRKSSVDGETTTTKSTPGRFHPISTIVLPPINGSLTFHDYHVPAGPRGSGFDVKQQGPHHLHRHSQIPIREIKVQAIAERMRLEASAIYRLLMLIQKPEMVATAGALRTGITELVQYVKELFAEERDEMRSSLSSAMTTAGGAGFASAAALAASPATTAFFSAHRADSGSVLDSVSGHSPSTSPALSFRTIPASIWSYTGAPRSQLHVHPQGQSAAPQSSSLPLPQAHPQPSRRHLPPPAGPIKRRLKLNADFSAVGVIIHAATPGVTAGCDMVQLDVGFSGMSVNVSVDSARGSSAGTGFTSSAHSFSPTSPPLSSTDSFSAMHPIVHMQVQDIFADLTLVDSEPESGRTRRRRGGRVSASVEMHSGVNGDGTASMAVTPINQMGPLGDLKVPRGSNASGFDSKMNSQSKQKPKPELGSSLNPNPNLYPKPTFPSSTPNDSLSRDVQVVLRQLHITLSPLSVAAAVDVIKYLENRLRDVDLSRQRQYLKKLRRRQEERIRASRARKSGARRKSHAKKDSKKKDGPVGSAAGTGAAPDAVKPSAAEGAPAGAAADPSSDGFLPSVSVIVSDTALCWILDENGLEDVDQVDGDGGRGGKLTSRKRSQASAHSRHGSTDQGGQGAGKADASGPRSHNLLFAIGRMEFSGRPSTGRAFLGIWHILIQLTPERRVAEAARVRVRNSVVLPEVVFRVSFEEEGGAADFGDGEDQPSSRGDEKVREEDASPGAGASADTDTGAADGAAAGVAAATIVTSRRRRPVTEWRIRLSAVGKALDIDLDSRFLVPLVAAQKSISAAMNLFRGAFVVGPVEKAGMSKVSTTSNVPAVLVGGGPDGMRAELKEDADDAEDGDDTPARPKQTISILGNKRLASCILEIDLAGAVVRLSGGDKGGETISVPLASPVGALSPAFATIGSSVTTPGLGGFSGPGLGGTATTTTTTTLKSPGVAIKTEYLDNGQDASFIGEIMVTASKNEVFPSVVGLLMDISDSVKEVVALTDGAPSGGLKPGLATLRPEDGPIAGVGASAVAESETESGSESFFDPALLLAKTKFSFGVRICKQDFTLSCDPYSRVFANASIDEIYVTTNTLPSTEQEGPVSATMNFGVPSGGKDSKKEPSLSLDIPSSAPKAQDGRLGGAPGAADFLAATAQNNFLALSARASVITLAIRHQFSRDSTFRFSVSSAVLSVMNSKHVSGSGGVAGLSAILRIGQVKVGGNARQGHDFLVFREIWDANGWTGRMAKMGGDGSDGAAARGDDRPASPTNTAKSGGTKSDPAAAEAKEGASALERYQAYSDMPIQAAIVMDGVVADIDLGPSIGKTRFEMAMLWARMEKGQGQGRESRHRKQTGWFGIDKVALRSVGRANGFVEVEGVRGGSVVEWRATGDGVKGIGGPTSTLGSRSASASLRPLIQVSAGFSALRTKVEFDYKTVAVANVAKFDFLMHNRRGRTGGVPAEGGGAATTASTTVPATLSSGADPDADPGSDSALPSPFFAAPEGQKDSLVAIVECAEISGLVTTLSSAQCVGLVQAGEKLVAENKSSFDQAMASIRLKFGRSGGGGREMAGAASPSMSVGNVGYGGGIASAVGTPMASPTVVPGLAPLSAIMAGPSGGGGGSGGGGAKGTASGPGTGTASGKPGTKEGGTSAGAGAGAGASSTSTAPAAATPETAANKASTGTGIGTVPSTPRQRAPSQSQPQPQSQPPASSQLQPSHPKPDPKPAQLSDTGTTAAIPHRPGLRLHTDVVVILGKLHLGVFPAQFSDSHLAMLGAENGQASFSVVPGLRPSSIGPGEPWVGDGSAIGGNIGAGADTYADVSAASFRSGAPQSRPHSQVQAATDKDKSQTSDPEADFASPAAAVCSSLGLTLGRLHLALPSIAAPPLPTDLTNVQVEEIIAKAKAAKGGVIVQVPKVEAMMRTWQSVGGQTPEHTPKVGSGAGGVNRDKGADAKKEQKGGGSSGSTAAAAAAGGDDTTAIGLPGLSLGLGLSGPATAGGDGPGSNITSTPVLPNSSSPPSRPNPATSAAPPSQRAQPTPDPTYTVDYTFKSTFAGQVDIGWNYSRVSSLKNMWHRHSNALADKLGKPLVPPPAAATKTKGTGSKDEDKEGGGAGSDLRGSKSPVPAPVAAGGEKAPSAASPKPESADVYSTLNPQSSGLSTFTPSLPAAASAQTQQQSPDQVSGSVSTGTDKPAAPVTVPVTVPVPQSSTKYTYVPLVPPVIQAPKLRDMGEATPPVEWIGFQRDKLPNLVHQIVIVPLVGMAREVEDVYARILGRG